MTVKLLTEHHLELTQDIIWESGKNTRKHHVQESLNVSPFPAGDLKAARRVRASPASLPCDP